MALQASQDTCRSKRLDKYWDASARSQVLPFVPVLSKLECLNGGVKHSDREHYSFWHFRATKVSMESFYCAANPAQRPAISFFKSTNLTLNCVCARTQGHKKAAR